MISAAMMMSAEIRIVVPKPTIKLFLILIFLKFICGVPPIFFRWSSLQQIQMTVVQRSSGPHGAVLVSSVDGRAGLRPGLPRGQDLVGLSHFPPPAYLSTFRRKSQTISPYFPLRTSPSSLPSTRVTTRRRMMFT